MHFCDVQLSYGEKQIPENTCLKQRALLVDTLGVLKDFYIFTVSCSLRSQKKKPNLRKRAHFLEPMFRNWSPKRPKGPIATENGGLKETMLGFGGAPEGQSYRATLDLEHGCGHDSLQPSRIRGRDLSTPATPSRDVLIGYRGEPYKGNLAMSVSISIVCVRLSRTLGLSRRAWSLWEPL